MKLLFVHGWGFDRTIWSKLAGLLDRWPILFLDRGYFGEPNEPPPTDPFVAVAHSHGAMRTLANLHDSCRGLIAINGFDRFAAGEDFPGVPYRVLERMIAGFEVDPGAVLAQFRARCGCDSVFADFATSLLHTDLIDLRDGDARASVRDCGFPILSIQSAADTILPPAMREAVFSGAPQLQRMTHPAAGHLLPDDDPDYCARAVAGFMERL